MTDRNDDLDLASQTEERSTPLREPLLADPRMRITNPAGGPVIYFDASPAFAIGHGVASITLTTQRQLYDAEGRVFEDRIITGLLRAPLSVMLALRDCIGDIETLAKKQAAALASAAAKPDGLPN